MLIVFGIPHCPYLLKDYVRNQVIALSRGLGCELLNFNENFYDTYSEVTRCKPLCRNGFYWQQLQFFLSLQEKNRPIPAERDKSRKCFSKIKISRSIAL